MNKTTEERLRSATLKSELFEVAQEAGLSVPEDLSYYSLKANLLNQVTRPSCPLTQLEFDEADFGTAERLAKHLGFTQTAYTTSSALWGMFCLPDRASQREGCIIKTKELGLLFVADCEDLLFKP